MLPSTGDGSEPGAEEWRNNLFLCYDIEPLELHLTATHETQFFCICNSLDCNKGGLTMNRHNKIRDGVAELPGKESTPSHVCGYPLIHKGVSVQERKINSHRYHPPTIHQLLQITRSRREIIIRDLWKRGTESIHEIRVMKTDAFSYQTNAP